MYNHVAPPNWKKWDCAQWSAISDVPGEHGVFTARSKHTNGVNVCYADGSVTFKTNNISLNVWRAIGSRNGGETVAE